MIQTFEVNGRAFSGYLSLPISGKGIGVLVFHGWWGLNNFILKTCDRLAQARFVALALDYYGGKTAKTIEGAKALKQIFDRKATNQLVSLAADFLISQSALSSTQVGALGFSLGASFAIEAVRRRSQFVEAVVLFYGTCGGKFDKTKAAFMGHFAGNDKQGVHAKKVNALADRNASEFAWQRTIEFLQDELT